MAVKLSFISTAIPLAQALVDEVVGATERPIDVGGGCTSFRGDTLYFVAQPLRQARPIAVQRSALRRNRHDVDDLGIIVVLWEITSLAHFFPPP